MLSLEVLFNLAEFHDSIPDEASSSSCRGVQESNIKLEIDGWYPLSFVAKDYHALYRRFQPGKLWRSWVEKGVGSITSLISKEFMVNV